MRSFVKLFFTLILTGSIAITTFSLPVLAEEIPTSPEISESETSETPTKEPEHPATDPDSGSEWDGIIIDPINTIEPNPEPIQLVITEVVTTVTPPSDTPRTSYSAPKAQAEVSNESNTQNSEDTEASQESESPSEPESITEPEISTTNKIQVEIKEASMEVPETGSTNSDTIDEATTRKITLLALISTAIVYFSCLELWGLANLIKIRKNEKLLKSADKKAKEVKETKISRAS